MLRIWKDRRVYENRFVKELELLIGEEGVEDWNREMVWLCLTSCRAKPTSWRSWRNRRLISCNSNSWFQSTQLHVSGFAFILFCTFPDLTGGRRSHWTAQIRGRTQSEISHLVVTPYWYLGHIQLTNAEGWEISSFTHTHTHTLRSFLSIQTSLREVSFSLSSMSLLTSCKRLWNVLGSKWTRERIF